MKASILFVDLAGYKKIPPLSFLKICSSGLDVLSVSSKESAKKVMQNTENLKIVFSNAPNLQLFTEYFSIHPRGSAFLLTDLPMAQYSIELGSEEEKVLDHIVANRVPTPWTYHELRVSLQKIIRNDLFGIEKYLLPSTEIFRKRITGALVRAEIHQEVRDFVRTKKIGNLLTNIASGIAEELLMNALYDAPNQREGGIPIDRKMELPEDRQSELSYGFDGSVLAIGVKDPFGRLTKEMLFRYLKKALLKKNAKELIDNKKAGAGLGLFSVLYNSHALVCNSKPQEATEVIAMIDIDYKVRDFRKATKSIHFFQSSV